MGKKKRKRKKRKRMRRKSRQNPWNKLVYANVAGRVTNLRRHKIWIQ